MNAFDLLKDRMGDNDVIYVSAAEMAAIVKEMPVFYYPKPQAPVKSKNSKDAWGLFYASSEKNVSYDHHAPEYLRELEEWRLMQEERQKREASGVIEFVGPTKNYKIELKK